MSHTASSQHPSRGRTLGVLAVLTTAVLWGTTGTAATFAPEVGPLAIGAAALGIGGLLQALIAVPHLRTRRHELRRHPALVWSGACAVFAYPLAFYSSMHLAGVAIGTAVSLATAPLASGALERVLERRPLSRRWAIAAALGIGGGALLTLAKVGDDAASAADTILGIACGLIAGIAYAAYSWCVHRLLQHGMGRAASMGAVFGIGGLLLIPVLLVTGAPLLANGTNLAVGAYMAIVPMFIGYLLFGYGLTRVSPSTATTLTLSEPAVAALLAVLVVGERLGGLGWLGMCGIGCALIVITALPRTAPPRPS